MNEPEEMRMDKWLFAVRMFKTRSQAADACRNGKVRLNGSPAKAAKPLRVGDTVTVRQSPITRTLKVVGLTERRVGAKLEGIIPALESSHAIAEVIKVAPTMNADQIIIANLSGRGDKDVAQVAEMGIL